MLAPTAAQQAAIAERTRSVIVIAGAGSGKTRVLVERFVGLLADHHDWPASALVAITFTEKAARELRERIYTTVTDRLYDQHYRSGSLVLARPGRRTGQRTHRDDPQPVRHHFACQCRTPTDRPGFQRTG